MSSDPPVQCFSIRTDPYYIRPLLSLFCPYLGLFSAEEKAKYAARDPITALKNYLLENDLATEADLKVGLFFFASLPPFPTLFFVPQAMGLNSMFSPFLLHNPLVFFSLCCPHSSPPCPSPNFPQLDFLFSSNFPFLPFLSPPPSPQAIEKKIDDVVEDSVDFADASPLPERSQLLENVFADPKGFGIGPDGKYRCEHPDFTSGTANV